MRPIVIEIAIFSSHRVAPVLRHDRDLQPAPVLVEQLPRALKRHRRIPDPAHVERARELEDPDDLEIPEAWKQAHWRELLADDDSNRVADFHRQLVGEVASDDDSLRPTWLAHQRVEAARLHRATHVRDRRLQLRVHALDLQRQVLGGARDEAHPLHHGCGADDVGQLANALEVPLGVFDAADLEHVDVRRRSDETIAQLALQAGHQREGDEESHHPDGDAQYGDE